MLRIAVLLVAGAALVASMPFAIAQVPGGGSAVVHGDWPTSVVEGEYEMESLVAGNERAVKQVDKVKLDVDGQKVSGKYLAKQSGGDDKSTFTGEWAKGSPAILMLNQVSPDGYHAYYVLQGSGKDELSGTWVDNQGHMGPVKVTLKVAAK